MTTENSALLNTGMIEADRGTRGHRDTGIIVILSDQTIPQLCNTENSPFSCLSIAGGTTVNTVATQ